MTLSDPTVSISCDVPDCTYSESFMLTAIARNSFDMRDVDSEARSAGWLVEGGIHTCPNCAVDLQEGDGQ